ncbi:hypothetical protein Syun_027619 [Stephania yunnanensis]|uniref:Uncharacterized protein n=1 Tax=Stephania yunnanensis TaxID=152371 RepID=A0AAP0EN77_9MAGN
MPPFATYLHSYMTSQFDTIYARLTLFDNTLADHTASLRRLKVSHSSRKVGPSRSSR